MTAPALYEIETSEGDDGTPHPVEQLWTPCEDATENGFLAHSGLHVTGMDDSTHDRLYPVTCLVLGHQKWAAIIEATAYMFPDPRLAQPAMSTRWTRRSWAPRTWVRPSRAAG